MSVAAQQARTVVSLVPMQAGLIPAQTTTSTIDINSIMNLMMMMMVMVMMIKMMGGVTGIAETAKGAAKGLW